MSIFNGFNRMLGGSASQNAHRPLEELQAFIEALSIATTYDEILRALFSEIKASLSLHRIAILTVYVVEEGVNLKPYALREGTFTDEMGKLHRASPVYARLFQQKDPLLLLELADVAAFQNAKPEETDYLRSLNCLAIMPLVSGESVIALLCVGGGKTQLNASDLRLLAIIGKQAGISLANFSMHRTLERQRKEAQEAQKALRMAKEQLEHLDDVKTDFITIASHELRTPLAQIRGYSDIISALNNQGILDPEQLTNMTGNLRKATDRMEELIRNMLDVSQLDVNAMDLNFSPVTIENVIRMSIEPITEAMRDRKQSLGARGLKGLPPIQADMKRLVQAFHNVIVNAVKFTPDGGQIDIYGSIHQNEETGEDEIMVAITDTGIGINEKNKEIIFEKFVRTQDPSLHSTGKTKFMGAGPGLGLTIARGVIDGHGGRIWVESGGYDESLLPGSTFYIVLPTEPPKDASGVLHFDRTHKEKDIRERISQVDEAAKLETGSHKAVKLDSKDTDSKATKPQK